MLFVGILFGTMITYFFFSRGRISQTEAPFPPMLVQPLVENALKHGLEPRIEGGEICIAAEDRAGELSLRFSDSGTGLMENGVAGVGLANAKARKNGKAPQGRAGVGARNACRHHKPPHGASVGWEAIPLPAMYVCNTATACASCRWTR